MRTKARYQVILAYDGTQFFGFQKQGHKRTVQDVVEAALKKLAGQEVSLLAAGRTDSGVHASGQVIAFDLEWRHSSGDLLRALNANMPPDVSALRVEVTHPGFHPRYDALWRRYRYRTFCQPQRHPLRERYAWRVWPAVREDRLQEAARYLVGRHDFAAFGTPPRAGGSTVRTVHQAGWQGITDQFEKNLLVFEIIADAFLYHMVRRLVALQIEIGQGILDVDVVPQYLSGEAGVYNRGLAPANGLVLEEAHYETGAPARIELEHNAFDE